MVYCIKLATPMRRMELFLTAQFNNNRGYFWQANV